MAIKVAIEGYDELEQIGVGGMAAVYRARKTSIDKIVAIKLLFPYLATDESYIERFQREAKAAASIQHENVVNIIDFGESDGAFFIVMEYYDGRTLEQLMKERPGLPPEIAIRILLEVAYGLEAAHTLDIVHRDVKPANIILTNQGGIKIADFGLARKTDSMTMITQHGKVVGTPAYMSPEQAAGRPVGPASDIFSFGVVAYELLSRRKPFDGQSYADVLEKIQTFEPPVVGAINPLISPELESVVKRCLAKNETVRFANAGELVLALEAAMEKSRIARDRRQLASYVKDPEHYDATFAEKTITECLSRGAFYMQKGRSHLDDAVLEYRRVLFLDPSHERATANLDRLRVQKGDRTRTVTLDALPVTVPAGKTRPAGVRTKPAGRRRARLYAAAASIVATIGVASWLASSSRDAGDAAKQSTVRRDSVDRSQIQSAGNLLGLHDGSLEGPDQAIRGADSARVAQTPPAGGPGAAKSGVATPGRDDGGAVPAGRKSSGTRTRNADAPDTSSLASDLSRGHEKPAGDGARGSEGTPPARAGVSTTPARETAPAPGYLSVYFLGGVGDLWVDGKLFPRQPPFDRASIASGTHRVSCRMSGDASMQEFTITIHPGRETVVEYEVGGKPTVTDG